MEKELLYHKNLLSKLSSLPKQILNLNNLDNITEFVFYDLCNKNCFDLSKAAYFVDNPDFNCIKGLAGFNQSEDFSGYNEMWKNPKSLSEFLKKSSFNNKVRNYGQCSLKKNNESYDRLINSVAKEMGFETPAYCFWDMKHYNHGVVIYEKSKQVDSNLFDTYFLNSLHLLSFCPIY